MSTLHLHLKGEYFDAIKRGEKTEEYRLNNPYWSDLIIRGQHEFTTIRLYRGYPKAGDTEKILDRAYNGHIIKTIQHKHFGPKPVVVFSIDVSVPQEKAAQQPPADAWSYGAGESATGTIAETCLHGFADSDDCPDCRH
jgi:hypothetical protein